MDAEILKKLDTYGVGENALLVSSDGMYTRLVREVADKLIVINPRGTGEPEMLLASQLLAQIEEGVIRVIPDPESFTARAS